MDLDRKRARSDTGAGLSAPHLNQGTQPPVSAARHGRAPRDLLWLAVVFVVALAVRLLYLWQLQASPWFAGHDMDPLFHHQWAEAVADGKPFWDGPYFRAPLYTWFLGAVYWLLGSGPWAARLVQAVLGSLNCVLLCLLGRRVFGRTTGVLAGLGGALYWILVYHDAELLSPVLIVFLNLLLLLSVVHTGARPSAWRWLVSGVLLGLSAIARPDILLLAPLLVVWLAWRHWPHKRRIVAYAACCAAGTLLPIGPVTIRNYVASGEFVPIATYGGVNFYIGNNPDADGMSAGIKGDPPQWWPCYHAQVARAEQAEGRPLTAAEVSRYYSRATWQYIRAQPGQAIGRMLRKGLYFWSRWEVGNNHDIYFVTHAYAPIVRVLPVGFWIVGPLGLLGLLLGLKRLRDTLPLVGIVLVYLTAAALFFVTARFRVPAAAVLVVFAAYAVVWLVETVRRRRVAALLAAAAALAAGAALAAYIPPNVDRLSIQGYRYAGFAEARRGRPAEAVRLLGESAAREAQAGVRPSLETWKALGRAYLELGQSDDAQRCFEKVLALAADDSDARENLAVVLTRQGRFDQAVPHYEALLQRQPHNGMYHGALGSALFRLGRRDEGLQHLRRAAELDPTRGSIQAVLGSTLVEAGTVDEGVACLLRGVALDPDQVGVLLRATQGIIERTGYADAIAALHGALEKLPDHPLLLARLAQLLATCPDPGLRNSAEAVRLAERAVQATRGQNPATLYAAAVAYWSAGREDDGNRAARRALDLAQRTGQQEVAERIRQQLAQRPNRPAP